EIVTVLTLSGQLTLNHHLRGDTCVVSTRLPKGVTALHTAVTNQRIHNGVIKTMTHMQAAGDVRRRNHNGVRLTRTLGRKVLIGFPSLVPSAFNGVRLIGLIHSAAGPLNRRRLIGKPQSIPPNAAWP